MTEYACTEARFLHDVRDHKMTVIRDDGVHRHLRFRRPYEGAYWFDLITWPGTLCIDGDMGTYVFRRLDDMFEFFRTDREWMTRRGNKLGINPSYWSEKLQSESTYGKGFEEFSSESFRRNVMEDVAEWKEANQPDEDASVSERDDFDQIVESLMEELEERVLSKADDGEIRAMDAAYEFESEAADDFELTDVWEWRCREYTFHFIWCCYAIAWGIQVYDDAKAAA